MYYHIGQCLAGAIMTARCLCVLNKQYNNPLEKMPFKKNTVFVLIIICFLFGCFLPNGASLFFPFFIAQSINDIKEKLVLTHLNNLSLISSVIFFVFSASLNVASYIAAIIIICLLCYGFRLFGSGDAKAMVAVLLATARNNTITDFLFFLLISYIFLFVFAIINNALRTQKGQPKEKHMYLFPFLFTGYIIEYIVLSFISI